MVLPGHWAVNNRDSQEGFGRGPVGLGPGPKNNGKHEVLECGADLGARFGRYVCNLNFGVAVGGFQRLGRGR